MEQIRLIDTHWTTVCSEARLSETDRAYFRGRQFLNAFALRGLDAQITHGH